MDDNSQFDDCILQEILSRLPAKSLGQFKCTNKRWKNLISSSLFVATQAARSVHDALGVLSVTAHPSGGRVIYIPLQAGNGPTEAPDTTLGIPRRHLNRVSIRAACNGLVFCRLNDPNNNMNRYRYMLSHPATKTVRRLPKPLTDHVFDTQYGVAFDPSMPAASFKLVACTRIVKLPQDTHFKFDIYSPQTNRWTASSTTMPCTCWRLFDLVSSVYFNGALHWLRENGDIVAFNVEGERAYTMSLPDGVRALAVGGYSDVWLGVARGKMCAVKFDNGIHVWEMEEYGSRIWELKRFVEVAEGGGGGGGGGGGCYFTRNVPVFYDGEKCVLLSWSQGERRECGLAVYRFRSEQWDRVRKLQGWMDCSRHFCPYVSHMAGLI